MTSLVSRFFPFKSRSKEDDSPMSGCPPIVQWGVETSRLVYLAELPCQPLRGLLAEAERVPLRQEGGAVPVAAQVAVHPGRHAGAHQVLYSTVRQGSAAQCGTVWPACCCSSSTSQDSFLSRYFWW